MNLAAFRNRYPEFNRAPDPLVTAVLDEALPQVSAIEYAARRDQAHGLLAADLLWSGAFGTSLRRAEQAAGAPSKSRYRIEFEAILAQVVPRIVVI